MTMTAPQQHLDQSEPKRVRFSVVEEFEYEADEYTEEEVALLWYTMEDMVELVKHELKLNNEESKKESHSWRGLEHMQSGVDDRAERVQQVCDAILDAYDDLCEDSDAKDSDKAEALRAECRALTRDDRKRAYKHGLKDQAIAENIHKDDGRTKRKQSKKDNAGGNNSTSSKDSSASKEKEARRKRPKGRTGDAKSSSSNKDTTPKRPMRKSPPNPASVSSAPTPPLRMNPIAA